MWRGLALALALCLLPYGGTESQASRLEDLRVKLEREGFSNISYIVVNHQGNPSQLNFKELKDKVSENITVYQQEVNQQDVWTVLNGSKDDFLIYDRCGRLVYHLGLPYTFLTFSYVEEAIKIAYCEKSCGNCSYTTIDDESFCKNASSVADEEPTRTPTSHPPHHHRHHHDHHHHHHHHQHHRHGHQPTENKKPEDSETAADVHSAQGLHHHHEPTHQQHRHTDHPGSQENPDSGALELSAPRKKL